MVDDIFIVRNLLHTSSPRTCPHFFRRQLSADGGRAAARVADAGARGRTARCAPNSLIWRKRQHAHPDPMGRAQTLRYFNFNNLLLMVFVCPNEFN
ncbi:hypothetical protein EVAR_94180_1 [Eumeta japonica]|uniref:Uncharacterized protein n=1 Tax=Eumeta variegata TaxID=151549 RepID=A0A4C1UMW9_EUMVA|nr:hypothetical protein EVAR_94180_1 [Eumeta japonica]